MTAKFEDYYKDEKVVASYEERRGKGLKANIVRMLERKYVELLVSGSGKTILEAGVGTGFISEILRKHGKVSGFDISPAMLQRTKKRFSDMKLTKGNILDLRLKGKYDSVVSIRVISHFNFNDARTALVNLKKVTKKGGYVIFNLENVSNLRAALRRLSGWGSTHNYQYSKEDIRKLMNESGFKIKKILYLDHLFLIPLHILNKIMLNSLDNFIFKIEMKCSGIKFASNNSFIKCQN